MNTQDNPLIQAKQVNVIYSGKPPKHAVCDVSFSIPAGCCMGFVGGSGCGKTTLSKAIVGLEPIHSGQILFNGVDISTFRGKQLHAYKRDVQMVFQDTLGALNPRMRVGEAIREVLMVHRQQEFRTREAQRTQVYQLLDSVELPESVYDRYPHEVSGGQRQRIGIARSLAVNPRILLADEPVSALDVAVQAQMLKMLHRLLKRTGLTLIFIAHDLAVVRSICDEVIVMDSGRIVETGDPRSLFANPQADFSKTLVDAIPDVQRALNQRDIVNG